jgi:hypothetical protein
MYPDQTATPMSEYGEGSGRTLKPLKPYFPDHHRLPGANEVKSIQHCKVVKGSYQLVAEQ